MSEFSFLAVPNIEGMRLAWYIQMVGILLLFGVCLFFVLYFRLKRRKGKQLVQHLHTFDARAKEIEKELLLQKIRESSGKELVILFVDYLERFVTSNHYANIAELLLSCGLIDKEIKDIEMVVYADEKLSPSLENKLKTMVTNQ